MAAARTDPIVAYDATLDAVGPDNIVSFTRTGLVA
jgi:hypothetical protein